MTTLNRILEELLFNGNVTYPDHPLWRGEATAQAVVSSVNGLVNPLNIPKGMCTKTFRANLYTVLMLQIPAKNRVSADRAIKLLIANMLSAVNFILDTQRVRDGA